MTSWRHATFCLVLLLSACGGTGNKRFAFDAKAGGVARPSGEQLVFTNERNWTVTLEKAMVTLGPVYLNVVPPLRDQAQTWMDFLVKRAWADVDGHLASGRVIGEVLGQVTFDALSPDLVPFPVRGTMTQEEVRTAEVFFFPGPGTPPERAKIDTVALDVRGTAVRDKTEVRFRGALVLDDTWQTTPTGSTRGALSLLDIRRVRGVPASFFPTEGGQLHVRLDVTRLFRGADFANLTDNPTDRDGTKVLVQSKTGKVTTDQVMVNLFQGLREADATYSIGWLDR